MSNTRKTAAAKPNPLDGAAMLARVKPKRRVERTAVCLRADLVAELDAEDEKLGDLKVEAMGNTNRLNPGGEPDSPAIRAQARKVRKIEDQIVDSQVTFAFESRNKDEWAALTADYPPRRDNQFDQLVGYHREQVLDALVRECMIEPVFTDCADPECTHDECGSWQQLVKVINPAEWKELKDTANLANSGVVDPPKSQLASLVLDRRASGSK